ncbi:MAG: stage III sporulation protein AD [Patescibacteria group bacterium]
MDFLPVLAFALVTAVLLTAIRPLRQEMAVLLSLAAGACLLALAVGRLRGVVQTVAGMAARAELNPVFLQTALKVVGVCYLAGFAAQVCRDAGEGALAGKVELVGKAAILVLALPVMVAILDMMLRLF